jgi:hypothetical protein
MRLVYGVLRCKKGAVYVVVVTVFEKKETRLSKEK